MPVAAYLLAGDCIHCCLKGVAVFGQRTPLTPNVGHLGGCQASTPRRCDKKARRGGVRRAFVESYKGFDFERHRFKGLVNVTINKVHVLYLSARV